MINTYLTNRTADMDDEVELVGWPKAINTIIRHCCRTRFDLNRSSSVASRRWILETSLISCWTDQQQRDNSFEPLRFYDPLGLLSPASIIGKLLFQDTWCRGIGWDGIFHTNLERDGTLRYPPYYTYQAYRSHDGLRLQGRATSKFTYLVMHLREPTERYCTLYPPKKNNAMVVWSAVRTD